MDRPESPGRVATTTSTTRSTHPARSSSTRRRTPASGPRAAAATTAVALGLALTGAPAAIAAEPPDVTAADPPEVTVVADGLVGPLSLDATPRGDVVVAQSFAGLLTRLDRTGGRTDLVALPGEEVAGVSAPSAAGVLYTHSLGEGPDAVANLERVDRRGRVEVVADLAAHEQAANPDGGTLYGLRDTAQTCLDQLPEGFPGRYTGEVYSHPYATARMRGGRTAVADAGGNALLSVDVRGRVDVVAALPAQPAVLTADVAAQNGLPDCVVGQTYWFEPVPTDVETGPDGALYASLLPGGPEDPSLGARGSVVRVDPRTGAVTTVLDGLLAATGVAVGDDGTVYATELFGGRVVALAPGADAPITVLEAELPAAVEVTGGDLWVTTQALGPTGQVLRVEL
ncbi:ScyD/ScyE family protein [uncultured Pseudokineococcus sp.]|uniref:ScyD/ScyE family protein n=1 Tax=uncultured Pseudokineococcus sp. TaxID=1642928 RepID=UPI0026386BB4|nr:ScyD/ScyE family protein [uncultured Pseudokineococcus sp.]